MKTMIKISKMVLGVGILTFTILCAFGIISYDELMAALGLATGGGYTIAVAGAAAGTAIQTPVTTAAADAASDELLMNTIQQKITKIRPDSAPLDTMMRMANQRVKVESWKTEFYSVETRGIDDTVKTGFDTSASGTYDSSTNIHTIELNNIHIWNVDDNILFRGINGSDSDDLVVHIVSKNASTSTVGVIALNGLGTEGVELPDIPISTACVRIGNSKNEIDAQTTPYAVMPQKEYNYCQIHMAQVEESVYEAMHAKEVSWGLQDFQVESIYDMRRSAELTSLRGYRAHKYDPEGADYKFFSHGLTRYVTKEVTYTAGSVDNDDFNSWANTIFSGNAGSARRILFAGNDFLEELATVSTYTKQVESKVSEIVLGIRFNVIETNWGILLVKRHPLFDNIGWSDRGLVLDLNNIQKHVFKPMEIRKLDLQTSGIRKTNAYVIDETFCYVLTYPDTHCVIKPA